MLSSRHTKYACYLSYFTSAVINNLAPLLFYTFFKEFNLSVIRLGMLITVNFFTQAVVDCIGAVFAEKIGYRKCIITAQCFAFCGLIFLGVLPFIVNPFYGILISVVIYATGSGIIEVLVSPMVEEIPESGKKASMSFLHSFYSWGQMAVILISTLYFVTLGTAQWRYLPMTWAVLPLISIIMFTKVPIYKCAKQNEDRSFKGAFCDKRIFIFMVLMLCSGAAEIAISQWASYFAESGLKVSKAVGDLFGPCLFAALMGTSRVLYGIFAERLPLKKAIVFSAALCTLSYFLIALSPIPALSLIGCGLCGFSVGIMWPGTLSVAAHSIHGGASIFGLLAFTGDIGCTLGPTLISVISTKFTLFGDNIKLGILVSAIFSVIIIFTIVIFSKNIETE